MNNFLLLVQEKEVKIPAPVIEGVACAPAAPTLHPPPVVLHDAMPQESNVLILVTHLFDLLLLHASKLACLLSSSALYMCATMQSLTCASKRNNLGSMLASSYPTMVSEQSSDCVRKHAHFLPWGGWIQNFLLTWYMNDPWACALKSMIMSLIYNDCLGT